MARPQSPQLTEAEQRIIEVLWQQGEASVKSITSALEQEHSLAYTTVLTTVGIMADKGYLSFRKEGRAHIYKAELTKERAQKKALGSILSSLFGGSAKTLAQHLVEDEKLSLEDIEALRSELLTASEKMEKKNDE